MAFKAGVERAIDLAHAAGADRLENLDTAEEAFPRLWALSWAAVYAELGPRRVNRDTEVAAQPGERAVAGGLEDVTMVHLAAVDVQRDR